MPDDQGFHCFPTVPDCRDIEKSPDVCPKFEVFVGDKGHFYFLGGSGELE